MKITVVKEFTFDAAHYLPEYDGKCKNLHGHTYRLQVGIKGEPDYFTGMVVDFVHLKSVVKRNIVNKLDHQYLNTLDTLPYFPFEVPTAETMVHWIVKVLSNYWPHLSFVRLYETPTSFAEWRAE